WTTVVIASAPRHPEWEGKSITALAAHLGGSPDETAKAVVDAEGYGAVVIIHSMNEADVRTVMAHPTTMVGSDGIPTVTGRPHPRLYGTFAKVLGQYVRDEHVLSIEQAVHRASGMPATKFGLANRGVIADGAFADLVLFDPLAVNDAATYDDPRRYPTGIVTVWVGGTAVMHDGQHTGERPGRTVRRGV
ncbi:MAG TPA: amidohydrolase family protein, partial [Acidimicrobiia bacterium]|nr:amidohydrolase family protein [Acidimicrobiia bacterium]